MHQSTSFLIEKNPFYKHMYFSKNSGSRRTIFPAQNNKILSDTSFNIQITCQTVFDWNIRGDTYIRRHICQPFG